VSRATASAARADRRHRHRHHRHGHLRLLGDHPQPRARREARGLHQEHHRAAAQLDDIKQCAWPTIRGTTLGSFLGILPGGGPVLGAFSAYTLEKKMAKDPSRFGTGAIEGVAAPESANNAAAQTSFIPLLTLGIPSNP
jgi:TctA family transporter